jgi:Na+/H+ antiporter NhaD/arsenite permease-like protein
MQPTFLQVASTVIFAIAIAHTFSGAVFDALARRYPRHEGIFHLLGEVEVVFGFWALVLVLFMALVTGRQAATEYIDSRNFTEPLFVFAIMVVAGSRPILQLSTLAVKHLARLLPVPGQLATFFLALSIVPLFGSLITEPGAMTLAALMLRDRIFSHEISDKLKYATVGTLFVNVSIGGTLTPFAAPPVLMVAARWGWDLPFMLSHFGWRAALAVTINALVVSYIFRREIVRTAAEDDLQTKPAVPAAAMVISGVFLLAVVMFAHHPAIFMGLLLFFIGYSAAYPRHHDQLILREALLVAFFLAGLVVLGGQQQWWLQPLLTSMSPEAVYYGATALTAVTDNAALTYLGSLVDGLSDEFKYALVAGAVTGGGLTVIANAPNPAGYSILKDKFKDGAISAPWLFVAALGPTLVAIIAFRWI